MRQRPTITLVAITATQVVRGDFEGLSDLPVFVHREGSQSGDGLADSVQAALAAGGKAGARVWVFAEDLWVQSVTLPSAQVRHLSRDELARALAFEVEPFSNIAPADAAIGFRCTSASGGTNAYRVIECVQREAVAVRDAVRKAGGRLQGILHHGELLVPVADGRPSPSRQVDLRDEAAAREWLSEARLAIMRDPGGMAVITARRPVSPRHRQVVAGVIIGVLAATLCLLHWLWADSRRDRMKAELSEIQGAVARIEAVEQSNAGMRQAIAALREADQSREEAVGRIAAARLSLPLFLRAVAEARTEAVVVRDIRDEGGGNHRIEGIGISARAIDEVSNRLASSLRDADWSVAQMEKTAQGVFADGGPWRFVLKASADGTLAIQAGMARPAGNAPPYEERW